MQTYLYDKDPYAWTIHNAELLKAGKYKEADMDHIIEEIEDLGRSIKRELRSRFSVLIAHLLKWQFQPALRSRSWISTIEEQRLQIESLIEENPSLQSSAEEIFAGSYKIALAKAYNETDMDKGSFPKECPYSLEQCLDEEFYLKFERI